MGYQPCPFRAPSARPWPGRQRPARRRLAHRGAGRGRDHLRLQPVQAGLARMAANQHRGRHRPRVVVGGSEVPIIAGPCSVESESQILAAAHAVRDAGAVALRGGAFAALVALLRFRDSASTASNCCSRQARNGLAIVTEAMDEEGAHLWPSTPIASRSARATCRTTRCSRRSAGPQAGAAQARMAATVEELLLSAEYILSEGNDQVILAVRRAHMGSLVTQHVRPQRHSHGADLSHLPMVADPSHGTGVRERVTPMARAAVAAGADGLLSRSIPTRTAR